MSRIAGFLGRVFKRLRLPVILAFQIEKTSQILLHPVNYQRRKEGARSMLRDSQWASFIDKKKGYALFGPETFPGTDQVIRICRETYARLLDREQDHEHDVRKVFFVNILDEETLNRNGELLEFVLSRPVVEAVTAYLNAIPILRGVGLYYSRCTESTESSQLFHIDYDDFHQVKCFMNIIDVNEGGGPFTLVPADMSARIRERLGHGWRDRRLSDQEVFSLCDHNDIVTLAGPAGSGGMVDTSACLHYGSRVRRGARLAFMFQYTTYPNVGLDNTAYSGQQGLPLYHFPVQPSSHDPLRQALLTPRIGSAATHARRMSHQ